MTARPTGRSVIERKIAQYRADADINEAEARALRVQADEIDESVSEARRLASELEDLLPTDEEAAK